MTKNGSAVDRVVDNIRQLIQGEEFHPGQKLPGEIELMHRYGVGRSTVREALRLLQAQGYVELRPNAGAFLFCKKPSNRHAMDWIAEHKNEVVDVMLVRQSVEGVAARMAAERATDEEIYCLIGIQTLMDQAAENDDSMKLALYDEAFHEAIAKSTHNPLVMNIFSRISAACANFRGKTFIANRGKAACEAHHQVLQAIQAHNGFQAEVSMQEHMRANIEMAQNGF